jgi:hypothetical protein
MPRRKEGTRITTTPVKVGINPHNIHPLRETRTKGTKTPKGAITTNAKGGIMLKPSTLVLFVACLVTTLTISPRSLISKGSNTVGAFPQPQRNRPLSRHNNNMRNNPLPPYYKILSHIKV